MKLGRTILQDYTFAPLEFNEGVDVEQPPTYPEVNPGYPGPYLRDPGELDPWEERDLAMLQALRSKVR